MDSVALQAFLQAKFLSSLTSLSVAWSPLGPSATQSILQNRQLLGLQNISICVDVNNPQIALGSAPFLRGLTRLRLCCIEAAGREVGEALAAAEDLTELRVLELGYGQQGDALAGALGRAGHLSSLSHLKITCLEMTGAGLSCLTAAPPLKSLRDLDISGNFLTDLDVERFAATDLIAGLRVLRLDCDHCTEYAWPRAQRPGDGAAAALAAAGRELRLRHLAFTGSAMSDRGFAALAHSRALPGLTQLEVDLGQLTTQSVVTLAAAKGFSRLEVLSMKRNLFRAHGLDRGQDFRSYSIDACLTALARSAACSRLRTLELPCLTHIGEDTARALLASTALAALRCLNVELNGVSDPIKKRFGDRFDF